MENKLIKECYSMPHMTIQKFLSKYYNISCSNSPHITHQLIECLFGIKPCLKIKMLDEERMEDIKTGQIILVIDGEKKMLGYQNPLRERTDEECKSIFDMPVFTEVHSASNHPLNLREEDILDLETYELENLLQTCKKNSDDVSKKTIIKELHRRKEMENNHKEDIIQKVRKREFRKEG